EGCHAFVFIRSEGALLTVLIQRDNPSGIRPILRNESQHAKGGAGNGTARKKNAVLVAYVNAIRARLGRVPTQDRAQEAPPVVNLRDGLGLCYDGFLDRSARFRAA